MKQTAVQFLVNELEKLTGLNLKDEPIIEKVLEMEKEQIIKAFKREAAHISGFYSPPFMTSRKREAEKYYNETYETQND